jgi:inosose dehydratase
MNSPEINRRRFLQTGMLASTVALGRAAMAAVVKPERKPDSGLKLGMASYTYRKFTLDQAIEMTKDAGLKYINLKADFHLPLKSTREECQAARAKIEAAGLQLVGGGVIYMKNNEDEIRSIFDYAVNAGMPIIVCSPTVDALDAVEKMAKQTGIMIAIHNHGPTDKAYPSPMDVYNLVKDRDPLMGICMDVGHTVRIGVDPAECIEKCGERLHDMHIKDETKAAADGAPTEVGRGVLDIAGILKALEARNYSYHINLEYEAHPDNPQPGVRESIGYIRGVLAGIA